ncbi:MAG: hypothetical protein IPK77_04235 [Cellvibrio sp.]|nr:hypothetical protein [Cellvibrio sp.]
MPINTNLLQEYRSENNLVSYYIDSQGGDDQNAGTSPDLAWKSLDRLGKIKLQPGDSVRLSRGSVFTNQHLYLDSDDWGTEEYPIIIEAYGQGELPTIEDPRALWDKTKLVDAISVKGRYIHIFDIRIKNAEKVWGVSLDHSSHHIIIGGMDIDGASGGIRAHGEHQKILSNYIRNIGSKGGNSGGICIVFVGKSLEFAWNRMVRCVNDTMTRPDGSAFEYYGYISGDDQPGYEYISEDIHIHHNFLEDGLIFMEAYGAVKNMTIAYNVYLNGGHSGILFHFDHSEPLDSLNHLLTYEVKIINNTFLPTQPQSPGGWGV